MGPDLDDAALALLLGIKPPEYLALEPDERAVTLAVVERAHEFRDAQHDDLMRLLGGG